MIRKIREKLGEKQLQRALKIHVRQKEFLNIEHVRSVGIIFDATDKQEFDRIKNYVSKLKQAGKTVRGIGFYDAKQIPEDLSYSKSDFDLFNAKEVQGLGTPSSPYIKSFITEVRDLLIDVNLKNKFPLRYIAAMSYARCKVGIDMPENAMIHDILVSVDPAQGTEKYLQQADVFLAMINKKRA
jgi:hypothetical protein